MVFFTWLATQGTLKARIRNCCLLLLLFYMPLVGYMFYNQYMFQEFVITTLHSGNLFEYFLPRRIIPRLEPSIAQEVTTYIESSSDLSQREHRAKETFIRLAREYPLIFCSALTESILKVFFGLYSTQLKVMYNSDLKGGSCSYFLVPGTTVFERLSQYIQYGTTSSLLQSIAWAEIIWLLVCYFLICCAFLLLWSSRNYFLFLFCASYIGYFNFVAAFDGCGRYRMMLEPVLIPLVAYALHEFYMLWQKYRSKKQMQEAVV